MSIENPQSFNQEAAKKKHTVVIASVDIEQQARDVAEEKLLSSKEDLRGFRGFFKRIWKHNLAHEYYRQKEIAKTRRQIKQSGNMFASEDGNKSDHEQAMQAIVERFQSEYENETMLRAGEEKRILHGEHDQSAQKFVTDLVKDFASGKINEEQFISEKERYIGSYFPADSFEKKRSQTSLYADNLLEIAKQVKESISHGAGLDAVGADIEVVFGKARTGVETQAQYNAVDKITEKIQKSFVGKWVNETTVASAVAIAYGMIAKGGVNALHRGAKLVGPLGMGLSAGIGGVVAGVRESKRIKEERAQHAREMAKGKKIEEDSPYREKMEKYRFETKSAVELTDNVKKTLEELKQKPSEQILNELLSHLNEIGARWSFAEKNKVDLIHFSNAKKVEQERTQMMKASGEARKFLVENLRASWSTFYRDEQGLIDYLKRAKEVKIANEFEKEKADKDDKFNRMRRTSTAWAVTKGMAIGLGVGVAAQEINAYVGGGKEGLFSGTKDTTEHHYTALGYLRHYLQGDLPKDHIVTSSNGLISAKEYVHKHEGMFSKVARDHWADNNTKAFDKNELRLHWGGSHGTGIDSRGNYVFNISKMLHDGSFHGGKHWDPQTLMHEGRMKILLTLSGDTKNQVIEIPIDAHGNAVIDPKSEIGRLAFQNVGGHAKFLGRMAEVAVMGKNVHGVDHVDILATHIGRGLKTIGQELTETVHETYDTHVPYVIPIVTHRPLEQTTTAEKIAAKQKKKEDEEKRMQQQATEEGGKSDGITEERESPTRAAAWHTIWNLENSSEDFKYKDLNGATPEERDQKFNDLTRKLWKKFAVHGRMKYNSETNTFELKNMSDVDGGSCLKLFEIAGFSVKGDAVQFVKPGESADAGVIADTSGNNGVMALESGAKLVFDHHGKDSASDSSATKFVYETLAQLGLIEKTPQLDAYVAFVTKNDNGDFTEDERKKIDKNFSKNLYGLSRKMSVDEIFELIENGQDPAEPLPEEYLKSHKIINAQNNEEQTLEGYGKYIGHQMGEARKILKKLERAGFVIDSGADRFGKIVIDTKLKNGKGVWFPKVPSEAGGGKFALAHGYGAYLMWSPQENSFVLCTKKKMDKESIPEGFSQGISVRGYMWLKSNYDNEPMTVSLEEILSKLAGKEIKIEGKLKEALENELSDSNVEDDEQSKEDKTNAHTEERKETKKKDDEAKKSALQRNTKHQGTKGAKTKPTAKQKPAARAR